MKKNDFITAEIQDIGASGEGIARYNGTTVFVPFALVREKAKIKILKVKGSVAFGKVEQILQTSEQRVQPQCPHFTKCGGCNVQHASYQTQLEFKTQTVSNCLKKIAFLSVDVPTCIPSPKQWEYRNKLQLPIRQQKGQTQLGFFREASHDVIAINSCPLHGEWATKIIDCTKRFIDQTATSCYNETTKKGTLKHLVVREVNGELLVVLVINATALKCVDKYVQILDPNFEKYSLYINENTADTNVIFGKKFTRVKGSGKIALSEFGINYEIGAESFMQVNAEQKHNLYQAVFDCANIDQNTVVIDGYSGAGVLTAMLAKQAKKAFGVEIIAEATESAKALAEQNGLQDKMQAICADCADVLPQIIKECKHSGQNTVLVLDPPRKGVDKSIINAIRENLPDKIIYVSCSPQSLARDLGLILGTLQSTEIGVIKAEVPKTNYSLCHIQPFDMFPQTKHVETLAVLERKNHNI